MVRNSTELLYALYCVYIGDQSPTEVMVIIKQFITMLRIQSPPYSSDSNNLECNGEAPADFGFAHVDVGESAM